MDIETALEELALQRPVANDDIVRAYRRMAKRFHPDKTTDPDEKSWVSHKFLRIQQAYEFLHACSIDEINRSPRTELSGMQRATPDGSRAHTLFSALVKWERHLLGHSLGQLQLNDSILSFEPHPSSILDKGFSVRIGEIVEVSKGDNFLWRGVVNIHLIRPLSIHFSFRVDPRQSPGLSIIERREFCSDTIRLFLGFGRDGFLHACSHLGISIQ
jgi:hypothetical protein